MADLIPKTLDGVRTQTMLDAIDREIAHREHVYARLCLEKKADGTPKMTQKFADDQIFIMRAIRERIVRTRGMFP